MGKRFEENSQRNINGQKNVDARHHYSSIMQSSHNEILLHIFYNCKTNNARCLQESGTTRTFIQSWKKYTRIKALGRIVWQFLKKVRLTLILWLNHSTLKYTRNKWIERVCPHKNLNTHFYSIFVCNKQN